MMRQRLRKGSASRSAFLFTGALVVGQLSQFLWLTVGSRTMSSQAFSAVLTAQAVYAVLQVFIDNGAAMHGARQAAAGTLTDGERYALVRVRLQLALTAVAIGLAIATSGGLRTVFATAPYLLALVLFAVLNVWERYGLGDNLPWASYMALRSAAPAAVAFVFLTLGVVFPAPAAGLAECAGILVLSRAFSLGLVAHLRGALAGSAGPWRPVLAIGLSAVFWQINLACGTVLLNALAASATATAFAVSLRLLTGLSAVSGVLITAIFPRLAARAGRNHSDPTSNDSRTVHTVQWAVYVVSALALGVVCVSSQTIAHLFLSHPDAAAQSTIILAVASATAAGSVFIMTFILVAHNRERDIFSSYLIVTPVTVGLSTAVAFAAPHRTGVVMAGVLLAGQLLTVELLARGAGRRVPLIRRVVPRARIAGLSLAAVGLVASELPGARLPIGVLVSSGAIIAGAVVVRVVLRALVVADQRTAGGEAPS